MQTGTVTRHGRGWRGYWREDGKRKATATYERKGEAREALNREFDRIRLGTSYEAPITLRELAERFLAQYAPPNPRTHYYATLRLKRPLETFGDAQARDLDTETLQRLINHKPVGVAYRRDIMRALRMVYSFGVDADIVKNSPARKLKAPAQARSERILPFESWDEVERVAEECGRWGPVVLFMADSGARPNEAVTLERRNVDGTVVELPGTKTEHSWRTVHLTRRGVEAIQSIPAALGTRRVFHIDGRPISWVYFWREVWRPALELAGLEYRRPYNLRHTYAYWSLKAGVPIATVAREMGHTSTEMTFRIYGGWCREMGADAAVMREAWAERRSHAEPRSASDPALRRDAAAQISTTCRGRTHQTR